MSICLNMPPSPAKQQCLADEAKNNGLPGFPALPSGNAQKGSWLPALGDFLSGIFTPSNLCALGAKGENCKNAPINNNYYTNEGGGDTKKPDNTLIYIGIGVAILLSGIGVFFAVKNSKRT